MNTATVNTATDASEDRSARRRATCRAAGQIALLASLAVGLVSHAHDVIRCAGGDEMDRVVCGEMLSPDSLPFTAMYVVTTVLAAVGLWATLRHGTARVWIARACAVGLAAPVPLFVVWAALTVSDPMAGWGSPWGLVISLMGAVAPWVLLLASYPARSDRARSCRACSRPVPDERGVAGWLGGLAAMIGLIIAVQVIARAVELPPVAPLVQVLGAGAIYGVLRWRRPLPGAGHWLPATLILTALLIPTYTWLRWSTPFADEFPYLSLRDTIAWALCLATVAVLGVLHWATTRRTRMHTHPDDDIQARARAGAVAAGGDTPVDPDR